jgi:radical SAM protein with 4Fe4S-binding SPASM domain
MRACAWRRWVGGPACIARRTAIACLSKRIWWVVGGLSSDLNLRISTFETHPLGKSQNPGSAFFSQQNIVVVGPGQQGPSAAACGHASRDPLAAVGDEETRQEASAAASSWERWWVRPRSRRTTRCRSCWWRLVCGGPRPRSPAKSSSSEKGGPAPRPRRAHSPLER